MLTDLVQSSFLQRRFSFAIDAWQSAKLSLLGLRLQIADSAITAKGDQQRQE